MQINRFAIRAHREGRAWSQEHLARASGLGLRTIQRIEATGSASYESVRSIAAALEIPLGDLLNRESKGRASLRGLPLKRLTSIAGIGAVTAGFLFATGVFAKDVSLNVGLNLDGERHTMALITPDGHDAEIRVGELMRVTLVPSIRRDGHIAVLAKIYEAKEGRYVLISQPTVVTSNRVEAEIRLTSDDGKLFSVAVTPTIE